METLIFQLQAPLSSWGEVAVGEYRPSAGYPSQSALHGLLGAALGIDRIDEQAQRELRASVRIAVGVLEQGKLLRDYHTAQVPGRSDLKKRPHATRRDELLVPRADLNTILSTRDYRQDAAALVALHAVDGMPYSLVQLAQALRSPRYVLYLGRKSCPVAVPLHPCLMQTESVRAAFVSYQDDLFRLQQQHGLVPAGGTPPQVRKIVWGDDFGAAASALLGVGPDLTINCKDQVISRAGWQFADRREYIALLREE